MEKIKELKQKVEQNERKVKFTHSANIIMSCGFMALGIIACITLGASPVITGLSKLLVRIGFPILGMTATVISNSWAIQTEKVLKDENKSLKLEIEKEDLKQQIQHLEAEQKLQKELKQDLNTTKTVTTNQKVETTILIKEEIVK